MSTATSRVEFARIELEMGNTRSKLTDIKELAADIKERGLLAPLVVRHIKQKEKAHKLSNGTEVWDRYILISGHRRYAALQMIKAEDAEAFGGWAKIPVTLFTGNEDDARFAQLAENIQRKDLPVSDIMEAIYKFAKRGWSQKDIAHKLSKPQPYVSVLLDVRERSGKELLGLLDQGHISLSRAKILAGLSEAKQASAVEKILAAVGEGKGKQAAKKVTAKAAKALGIRRMRPAAEIRKMLEVITAQKSVESGIVLQTLRWVLGEEVKVMTESEDA